MKLTYFSSSQWRLSEILYVRRKKKIKFRDGYRQNHEFLVWFGSNVGEKEAKSSRVNDIKLRRVSEIENNLGTTDGNTQVIESNTSSTIERKREHNFENLALALCLKSQLMLKTAASSLSVSAPSIDYVQYLKQKGYWSAEKRPTAWMSR